MLIAFHVPFQAFCGNHSVYILNFIFGTFCQYTFFIFIFVLFLIF